MLLCRSASFTTNRTASGVPSDSDAPAGHIRVWSSSGIVCRAFKSTIHLPPGFVFESAMGDVDLFNVPPVPLEKSNSVVHLLTGLGAVY